MTLIVEDGTGVTDADSYTSVSDANAYFVGRRLYSSAWTVSSTTDKEIALRQASVLLDNEFTWSGQTSLIETQGLDWPLKEATNRYGNPVEGLPKQVVDATCEVAFYLLAQDRLLEKQGVGLTSLKVDSISLVFDKNESPKLFPPHVSRMLVGLGTPISSDGIIKTVRLNRV